MQMKTLSSGKRLLVFAGLSSSTALMALHTALTVRPTTVIYCIILLTYIFLLHIMYCISAEIIVALLLLIVSLY